MAHQATAAGDEYVRTEWPMFNSSAGPNKNLTISTSRVHDDRDAPCGVFVRSFRVAREERTSDRGHRSSGRGRRGVSCPAASAEQGNQ